MNSVQRAIFFSAVERYASVVLFFASTAALARLLTPKEFGIYAVVLAVTSVFSASSQEFGGPNYLIQKASLSEENIRAAFTITFGLSVTIGIVLYLIGGALGTLLGADGLEAGIAVAVLNFVITPFSMTIIALLRRNMQFGTIAASNLASNFTMVLVSIGLAMMGYSYLAPIWGMIAGSAVQTAYLIGTRGDLRIFRPSLEGYPDIVRFGLYSSGVVLINVFYNSAPQLFLARMLDFAAVGLYSRASNVTQAFEKLIIQVISPVIMPAIFAQTSAGGDLKRIYLHADLAAHGLTVAFSDLRGGDGKADDPDLAWPVLARGGSVGPPAVHCPSFTVRRLPYLPRAGRRRERAGHAALVTDLIAAIGPHHVRRVFLRGGSRGSIGVADVAVPGSHSDLLC